MVYRAICVSTLRRLTQILDTEIQQLSNVGRRAWRKGDWATVDQCANEILRRDGEHPEGWFFRGMALKAAEQPVKASQAFEKILEVDADRYDAAIELAGMHSMGRRGGEAAALIARYTDKLENSPKYLDMAGVVYSEIGLPERAWPLFKKANELQPGVDPLMANLAACGVYLGKIEDAKETYQSLLSRHPNHQHNHYQLARLESAKDDSHIIQMKKVLRETQLPDDRNIFIYYAIGKELEDLGRWDEAFEYYQKAGDAVMSVANYDVEADLGRLKTISEVCNADWLQSNDHDSTAPSTDKTPIFVVGLPRTGTTLTERIISSHSQVSSLGETEFFQMQIRRESGVASIEKMTAEMIRKAADADISHIGQGYLDAVAYRLGDEPMFIDKLPYNFLFLGFIAKAYPDARIVHLRRNPLDSCFSMYKQVFTWAYKFSYSLENLGRYFVAHERLRDHWAKVLGDRFIEVEYEQLVADADNQIPRLLDRLGLEFEDACLNFDQNKAASTTASSVQVREKIHGRSVERWRQFEEQLQPLRDYLKQQGIDVA